MCLILGGQLWWYWDAPRTRAYERVNHVNRILDWSIAGTLVVYAILVSAGYAPR